MADEDFQVPEFTAMALSTAASSGWKGTEFLACWLEAFRLAEGGRIEEALDLLNRALGLAREVKSKLAEAGCLLWLAYELMNLGDVTRTSQYLHVALSLLEQVRLEQAGEQISYLSPFVEMAVGIQTYLARCNASVAS